MDDQNNSNFSHNYGVLQAENHHVTTKELFRRSNPSRFQDFQDWINDLNAMVSPWFTSKEQYLLSRILDSAWTDALWLLQISKGLQCPAMSCLGQHQHTIIQPTFYPATIPSVEPMQAIFSIYQDNHAVISPEFITTTSTSFENDSPVLTGFTNIPRTPPTVASASTISSSLQNESSIPKIKSLAVRLCL